MCALVTRKVSPDVHTPQSYYEAVNGPDAAHWIKAIEEELASLRKRGTWKAVPVASIPAQARRIKTKWVFKLKLDTQGRIVCYKARLVVCGYAQKFGRDYDETFAPVASSTSIRSVFALAAARGLLDHGISNHESIPKLFRQGPAGAGFAAAHHPHQIKAAATQALLEGRDGFHHGSGSPLAH